MLILSWRCSTPFLFPTLITYCFSNAWFLLQTQELLEELRKTTGVSRSVFSNALIYPVLTFPYDIKFIYQDNANSMDNFYIKIVYIFYDTLLLKEIFLYNFYHKSMLPSWVSVQPLWKHTFFVHLLREICLKCTTSSLKEKKNLFVKLHSDCNRYLVSSHVVTMQLPTRCLVDRFLHRPHGSG